MSLQSACQQTAYDFTRCKLCGRPSGVPTCRLDDAYLHVCRDCDFHYLDRLDPAAADAAITLTAEQLRYMDDRLDRNARVLAARMQLLREFVEMKGRHALDVGTGVGQFLPMLAAQGASAEGIEPSALRRAFARHRFGLDLHAQSVEDPLWQERLADFDLLTLWDVLEHVNDPVATLQRAFDLLRPGGLLFIETDNRDRASYRLSCLFCRLSRSRVPLFLSNYYRPVPYGHKQMFRPEQLYALITGCGFELVATTPRRSNLPTPSGYRPRGQIVLVARKP